MRYMLAALTLVAVALCGQRTAEACHNLGFVQARHARNFAVIQTQPLFKQRALIQNRAVLKNRAILRNRHLRSKVILRNRVRRREVVRTQNVFVPVRRRTCVGLGVGGSCLGFFVED